MHSQPMALSEGSTVMTTVRPHSPRARRLLAAAVAATALQLSAAPASAHDDLISSTPAAGETVARPPDAVVLVLDERPLAIGIQVVVTGPAGPVQRGASTIAGNSVRQPLASDAPAGKYTVAWRVASADGHPVTGTFPFIAKTAAAGQAPPKSNAPSASMQSNTPSPPPQSNAPAAANEGSLDRPRSSLMLGGALVLAGGVGAVLWRWLRRRPDVPSP